jgi:hypothetical protein
VIRGRLTRAGAVAALAGAAHAAANARGFARVRPGSAPGARISVLVPARDEAARLPALLACLRQQDVTEIVVLDDGSSDPTAEVVRKSEDPRVRLVTGRPMPTGWGGKPHACSQLVAAADPASDILVFLDADVRLAPGAVAGAVQCLRQRDVDLLSVWPRQQAQSPAERLVQPLQLWAVLTFLPLGLAERTSHPSLAAANGQFLVVRRRAYQTCGGHAAKPRAVLDDIELARTFKRSGFRTAVVSGQDVASCRMYEDWGEVRDGYAKSLWSAFGSRPAALVVAASLLVGWVAPAAAALRGSPAGVTGVLAGCAGRVVTARAGGDRVWPDAAAQPVSALLLAYLIVRSVLLSRTGRRSWRGRPVRPGG